MPQAIVVHQPGGPDVLRWEEVAVDAPGPGTVRVRHKAVGLNFIDVYHRTGLYSIATPFTPGLEAAGVVEAVGEGVSDLKPGDRVAYGAGPLGAYATERLVPAEKVVPIPEGVSDEAAAAMMLKGMTACYLLRRTFVVKPGDPVLFHAAAGGVGQIAGQWAKHLGAITIGTVGSAAKVEIAKAHGYDHVVDLSSEDLVERVKAVTDGKGVPVVYDSIGKDTFERSLDCLRPRGLMVAFGQSSGSTPPLDLSVLGAKGSLYLTRPSIAAYTATVSDLRAVAGELFEVVSDGAVSIDVNQRYPLAEASEAHRDLEARRTTGSTVLLP